MKLNSINFIEFNKLNLMDTKLKCSIIKSTKTLYEQDSARKGSKIYWYELHQRQSKNE